MHNSKLPPSPLALVRAICRRKEDLQPLSVLLIKYEPRRCAFSFSSTFQWLSAVVREGSECPPSQTRGRRKEGILINCHSSLRSPNDHRRRPFIKAAGFRGHEIIQKSACVVGTWSSPFSVTSFQMCVPIPEWTINLSRPSVRVPRRLAAPPACYPSSFLVLRSRLARSTYSLCVLSPSGCGNGFLHYYCYKTFSTGNETRDDIH